MAANTQIHPDDALAIEEMYPALRRFAAVVAPYDVEPDDVLHDALLRVLSRRTLAHLRNPPAYLKRAMINVVIDAGRTKKRGRRRNEALKGLMTVETEDVYPSDLDILRKLTPRSRAVLYMVEVEGYTYAEVGQLLSCTETAARMRAMRARRQLRRLVIGTASHG